MQVLLIHFGEIWLKGCNRNFFIRNLRGAVKRALQGIRRESIVREDQRILIFFQSAAEAERALQRLLLVPGIANIGLGRAVDLSLDAVERAALELMADGGFRSFAVRAKRANKHFPLRSMEIERRIGAAIVRQAQRLGQGRRVDLENPERTCFIEITSCRAVLYARKARGVGGLPPNSSGRLLCLLSGGIDSPVAAYRIICRGVRLGFVHFHGGPAAPGEASEPVARALVRRLTVYQGASKLYLVPFDRIQREIVAKAPQSFRILIYRRMMIRIAERLAWRHRARGIVTGDSIGQVASQTLANMNAVGAAAGLPLYRPLCGTDKEEIMALARRIGTYDISIEPFSDCCPMYLPRSPEVFASVAKLDAAEAHLDIEALVKLGTDSTVREIYEYENGEAVLKQAGERQQAA